jgi:hypothetical protein
VPLWEQLKTNPKSARDRQRNAEIIRQHNQRDQEEDIYGGEAAANFNLFNRNEESDSENEVR